MYISESVEKAIKGQSVQTKDLGEFELKNVDYLVRIYAIQEEGLPLPAKRGKVKSAIHRRIYIVPGVVLAVVIIIIGLYLKQFNDVKEKSIAVLLFNNLSADQNNQYYADGVMESILNHLAKVKELSVTSRTSMEQYRDTDKTIPEIAEELGVSYILEGSFQKYGNQIRITAQLIDGISDEHLWSEEYTESIDDIFLMMTRVAMEVASQMKATISPAEQELLAQVPTTNAEAFDYYLQGRQLTIQSLTSHNDSAYLPPALNLYRKALEIDSTFALAYVGMGKVFATMTGVWGEGSKEFEKENTDSILYFASKAILYDPNLAEAYSLRGDYYAAVDRINEAIQDQETALGLNPNLVEAYFQLGVLWAYKERDHVKGIIYFQKAGRIEKNSDLQHIILEYLAWEHMSISDFDRAQEYFDEALRIDEGLISIYGGLVWLHFVQGNFEKAREYADIQCQLGANCDFHRSYLFYYMGEYDSALYYYDKIESRNWEVAKIYKSMGRMEEFNAIVEPMLDDESGVFLAVAYALMGDEERSMEELEEAENNGSLIGNAPRLRLGPVWEEMRTRNDFQELIYRLDSADAELRRQVQLIEEQGL